MSPPAQPLPATRWSGVLPTFFTDPPSGNPDKPPTNRVPIEPINPGPGTPNEPVDPIFAPNDPRFHPIDSPGSHVPVSRQPRERGDVVPVQPLTPEEIDAYRRLVIERIRNLDRARQDWIRAGSNPTSRPPQPMPPRGGPDSSVDLTPPRPRGPTQPGGGVGRVGGGVLIGAPVVGIVLGNFSCLDIRNAIRGAANATNNSAQQSGNIATGIASRIDQANNTPGLSGQCAMDLAALEMEYRQLQQQLAQIQQAAASAQAAANDLACFPGLFSGTSGLVDRSGAPSDQARRWLDHLNNLNNAINQIDNAMSDLWQRLQQTLDACTPGWRKPPPGRRGVRTPLPPLNVS